MSYIPGLKVANDVKATKKTKKNPAKSVPNHPLWTEVKSKEKKEQFVMGRILI